LFPEQTAEALRAGLQEFERSGQRIAAEQCRRNAQRFRPERFRQQLREYVEAELRRRGARRQSSYPASIA
jgi:hypothetical protein